MVLQVLIQAGRVCSGVLKFGFMTLSSRYGPQTMCEGGGMANATIIERGRRRAASNSPAPNSGP